MKRNIYLFLLGFIIFVLSFIYVKPSLDHLNYIFERWHYIVVSSILFFISLIFRSLTFPLLSLSQKDGLGKFMDFCKTSIGSMLSNEIFLKGSGDVIKTAYLKRQGFSYSKSALISVGDRAISFVSLTTLPVMFLNVYVWIVISMLFVVVISQLGRFNLIRSLMVYAFSFLGWVFELLSLYLVFTEDISLITLSLLVVLYTVIGYISLIPLSLGIRETIFVIFSQVLSKSSSLFFTSSLLFRISVLLGFIYVYILFKLLKDRKFYMFFKGR